MVYICLNNKSVQILHKNNFSTKYWEVFNKTIYWYKPEFYIFVNHSNRFKSINNQLGYPALLGIFIVSSVSLFHPYISALYLSIFVFLQFISLSLDPLSFYFSHLSLSSISVSLPPSLFPDKKFPALGSIPNFRSKFSDYKFIQQINSSLLLKL